MDCFNVLVCREHRFTDMSTVIAIVHITFMVADLSTVIATVIYLSWWQTSKLSQSPDKQKLMLQHVGRQQCAVLRTVSLMAMIGV